jgi:lipopolysaccharide/colanic/teichoic acid biosynthesis glycosyltransferase
MTMKNLLHDLMFARRQPKAPQWLPMWYPENNLSSPDQFQQRLLIEKRRAERLNSATSLIVLDLSKYLGATGAGGNGQEAAVGLRLDELLKSLCAMIRETDVVCLYQENLILILLPDTDTAAARWVYERLTQQLNKRQQVFSQTEEFNLDEMEMEIISYPEKLIHEQLPKNGVARRAKEYRRNAWEETTALKFAGIDNEAKDGPVGGLHLSLGAALTVPIFDVCWWDPQAVSDLMVSTQKFLKRGLDIIGAITGLILLSPLLLLAAFLIKTTSRGPILFKQKRVGYRGEYFTFLKLRTMYDNCENRIHQEYVKRLIHGKNSALNNGSQDQPVYKIKNDPRITPVGRFLRKTSLDELPQLWNVLVGQMSLVGPRPPIPYEVEEYQKWHLRRILEVKPGITGLWQISGRNKTTFDEMVRLDIYYAKNWSLALDLRILLKTIKVVLLPDGV